MSLIVSVNQIEYTTVPKGAVLHIFGRDEIGNPHRIDVSGYRPYFYAPLKQSDMLQEIAGSHVDVEKIYHTIKGQELRRIYVTHPNDLRDIRSRYQHFEADIPFGTKFMLDAGIKSGIKVNNRVCDCGSVEPFDANYPANLCIADIECEDHRGFPEPERDAIIAVTVWDSFSNKYVTFVIAEDLKAYKVSDDHEVRVYITEVAMLTAFSEYIVERDPDILTGWNFIEFDLPYILKRMTVIGLDPMKMSRLPGKIGEKADKLRGRVIFDLLTAYKRIHVAEGQEVSYRLDAVAESQLGEHKVKYDGNLSDLRVSDPKKLVEYNKVDVELCVKINNKSRIIDFYREISRYVGCPLDKTLNSSNVVDYYVLRRVNGKYILPSRGNISLDKFQGATVFAPYMGLDENIAVFDLKSLYPMSMMTLNASPETKDPNGELHSPDGTRFKKQPDGLTRSIITDLLKERDDKKSQMKKFKMDSSEWEILNLQQNVLKVIMNTYYGVSGYPRFRLFDHDIGSATTSTGRAIIEYSKQVIESEGYKVIYGDTDSSFVHISGTTDQVIEKAKAVEKKLNDAYPKFAKDTLGADISYFSTKFEKLYKRYYQGGKKKRYAGNLIWKEGQVVDKIDIVGFEFKRSDSSKITKEVQEELLKMILRGKTFKEIQSYMYGIVKNFKSLPLDDIAIPGGIGKSLNDYAVDDAQVRGCKYANEHLGARFLRGSKPKRVYISHTTGKYPKTDVIAFEYGSQVPKEFVVDYALMIEKTLKNPISRVIEPLGWKWSDFDPSSRTLSQFGLD
jgi:DNA polymerase, archaea type